MGTNEKILVVEDDRSICELIEMNLLMAGFARVYTASNGERGLAVARQECPDLIILDIMLPGMNGWAVCRALKEDSATAGIPVIILTAKGEEQDIVYGLELGAVDYVTKPFSNKVLIARVKAQLRNKNDSPKNDVVSLDGLHISNSEHIAKIHDRVLELTAGEFSILELLAETPGKVFTRNQIVLAVRGKDYPVTERAIDVQIVNLRRKLADWAPHLETVRGIGYKINSPDAEEPHEK